MAAKPSESQLKELMQRFLDEWRSEEQIYKMFVKKWWIDRDEELEKRFEQENAPEQEEQPTPEAWPSPEAWPEWETINWVEEETPANNDKNEEEYNSEWWEYAKDLDASDDGSEYGKMLEQAWVGVARDSKAIKWIMTKLVKWLKWLPESWLNKIYKHFIDNASLYFWKNNPEMFKELSDAGRMITGWEVKPTQVLSWETKKKILSKFLWTIWQWLFTDAVMLYDVNEANKKATNKNANWAAAMDAIDSATETLPILSWVDLLADAWTAIKWAKDENWESYSRWWLLSKANFLINKMKGKDSARTFWENSQEEQMEDLQNMDWMKKQWFKWSWWNTGKPSAKEWSKADAMLKDSKAMDKIDANKKWKGQAATDWISTDKADQDRRDAKQYIVYINQSKKIPIWDKKSYTEKDFVKDFVADKDGTWINKKTWKSAGQMWNDIKKGLEKPEWESINI